MDGPINGSGGGALDFTSELGFDIPADITVSTSNAAAVGPAYAQLVVAGVTRLYSIELSTGAATSLGTIGAGGTEAILGAGGAAPATRIQ